MSRQRAERRGRRAESIAALWLMLHGWRIVARRVKTPRGEVDLIASRWKVLAFVEVKARGNAAALDGAVDPWRLRRVAAAAEILAPRHARRGQDIRIDLMLIAPWRLPRHRTNVWTG